MSEPDEVDRSRSIPVSKPAETRSMAAAGPRTEIGVFERNASIPSRPPFIDIHETQAGLVLEADVAGASDRTLTIHLEDNVLHLRATLDLSLPDTARLIQQEYPVADFERTFILSDEVERSQITAELKHGVLRIVLPRAERGLARRIDVRAE